MDAGGDGGGRVPRKAGAVMAWVKFDRDHVWTPNRRRGLSLSYRAGCSYNMTRAGAKDALDKGAAKRTVSPARKKPEPKL